MVYDASGKGVTVVRLSGPMMAWPSPAQYRTKSTYETPTYSTLVGLLHAAGGVSRSAQPPEHLAQPHIAIRVENPGTIGKDYQTVNPPPPEKYRHLSEKDAKELATVRKPDGNVDKNALLIEKQYVQDQTVLVAYADPDGEIWETFSHPHWALYAGRKSCVLTHPFLIGHISTANLFNVFSLIPYVEHLSSHAETRKKNMGNDKKPVIFFSPPDTDYSTQETRYDEPGKGDSVGHKYSKKKRWETHIATPMSVKNYHEMISYVEKI